MAHSTWHRVRNSVKDVLRPTKGWWSVVRWLLALLAAFGLPVAAFFEPGMLLPPRPWGLMLWFLAILGTFALGVLAAYRHRSQREDEADARRADRDEKRDAVRQALMAVTRELARHPVRVGLRPFDPPLKQSLEGLSDRVAQLPDFEASVLTDLCADALAALNRDDLATVKALHGDMEACVHRWPISLKNRLSEDEIAAQMRILTTLSPRSAAHLERALVRLGVSEEQVGLAIKLLANPPSSKDD